MFISGFEKTAVRGRLLADMAAKAALTHMGYDVKSLHQHRPVVLHKMVKAMKDKMYSHGIVFWSSPRQWSIRKGATQVRHSANRSALKAWERVMKTLPHRFSNDTSFGTTAHVKRVHDGNLVTEVLQQNVR